AFGIEMVAVTMAAFGVGLGYYLHARAYETTDDAFIDGSVVQISPKVGGYATKVAVNDNQHVKKGDLLVEIDSRDYENRVLQVRAQLQAAESRQKAAQLNLALTRVTTSAGGQQAYPRVDYARFVVQYPRMQLTASRHKMAN